MFLTDLLEALVRFFGKRPSDKAPKNNVTEQFVQDIMNPPTQRKRPAIYRVPRRPPLPDDDDHAA
jgi:hypothetical protein